jgi:hypothetical protein
MNPERTGEECNCNGELFYSAFSTADYIVSDGRTTNETERIWKNAIMA